MLARSSAQLRPVITSANRLDLARFMSSAANGANPADQLVLVDRQGPVTVLTLNRPKALNALSSPLFVQLNNELDKAAQDDQVKCIVLTGGEKVFAGESRRSVIGRSFKNEGTVVTKLYVCVCLLQPARTSRR
jgi:1,4-dihydroxy-2-naphthoyl-CoA synthase